jgi:lipoate-protein ligase B
VTDSLERPCGWILNLGQADYKRCLDWQRGLVRLRKDGFARDTIIFVEHPPVITVGRDGHAENFCGPGIEPIEVERGGDVTYHGPGQQVVYFVFNLTRRGRDIKAFLLNIQAGIVDSMAELGISATSDGEHAGVWIGQNKIASIGVAIKQWITFHGAAINLNTDLDDFRKINPCGLKPDTMTSAEKLLGKKIEMDDFRVRLGKNYERIFDMHFDQVKLEELAEDVKSQEGGFTI